MNPTPQGTGWIEVVTGCMFSGKSEELIRRLRRAQFARQQVVVFKPSLDQRYSADSVDSHSGLNIRCFVVDSALQIPGLVGTAQVVGIDEAQFFGGELVQICEDLANRGCRVIAAGLDQDYLGRPFEPIPQLLAVAEFITKNLAICMVCGNPADRSQRVINRDARFLVGETDAYEARCRRCWRADVFEPIQQRLPMGENLAERETTELVPEDL